MKKLDRKGFTLIELLAVIVILAIIIALVFPQIMNVIDNSKISTIHSNAKSIVNWWETTTSADALISDSNNWQISSAVKNAVYDSANLDKWVCIDSVAGFAAAAGLSSTDYVLGGNPPTGQKPGDGTCSAIKYTRTGKLEVLLIADSGGKNYIAGKTTYAYSEASGGNIPISE